ncbi:MAG TPA: ribbon-helix-helix domain-containing protein [Azospirillum sp.]
MAAKGASNERPALICRNVTVSGRRTSLRMEPLLWDSLKEICEREGCTLNELCTMIDSRRGTANLTASIRVFIVSYFRQAVAKTPRGFGEDGAISQVLRRALQDAVPLDE